MNHEREHDRDAAVEHCARRHAAQHSKRHVGLRKRNRPTDRAIERRRELNELIRKVNLIGYESKTYTQKTAHYYLLVDWQTLRPHRQRHLHDNGCIFKRMITNQQYARTESDICLLSKPILRTH